MVGPIRNIKWSKNPCSNHSSNVACRNRLIIYILKDIPCNWIARTCNSLNFNHLFAINGWKQATLTIKIKVSFYFGVADYFSRWEMAQPTSKHVVFFFFFLRNLVTLNLFWTTLNVPGWPLTSSKWGVVGHPFGMIWLTLQPVLKWSIISLKWLITKNEIIIFYSDELKYEWGGQN